MKFKMVIPSEKGKEIIRKVVKRDVEITSENRWRCDVAYMCDLTQNEAEKVCDYLQREEIDHSAEFDGDFFSEYPCD